VPDLTPGEVAYARFQLSRAFVRDTSLEASALPLLVRAFRQLQTEKHDAFTDGRKQGWKDAGLSLDAQDTLTAALNAAPDVA
jgi:hypothetical protein